MAIRSVGQLGPSLDASIADGEVWYDVPGQGTLGSPQLGSTETDTDGNIRIFVQASAEIASAADPGTEITIDRSDFTAAAGAGGAYSLIGVVVPDNAYFWARYPVPVTA